MLKWFVTFVRDLWQDQWFLGIGSVCAGVVVGFGIFIFIYAKGYSYISNAPEACANCHIMQEHYDSWVKSSHHKVAGCNDCHVPHSFLGKYFSKARNGYYHSKAFTLQDFQEPIRIKEKNLELLQENCIECHAGLVSDVAAHADVKKGQARCTLCHRSVGHMSLD